MCVCVYLYRVRLAPCTCGAVAVRVWHARRIWGGGLLCVRHSHVAPLRPCAYAGCGSVAAPRAGCGSVAALTPSLTVPLAPARGSVQPKPKVSCAVWFGRRKKDGNSSSAPEVLALPQLSRGYSSAVDASDRYRAGTDGGGEDTSRKNRNTAVTALRVLCVGAPIWGLACVLVPVLYDIGDRGQGPGDISPCPCVCRRGLPYRGVAGDVATGLLFARGDSWRNGGVRGF
eukprot:7388915-Prymnesium_polylepis.1